MSEKLQKILARAGLGSRRQIETWISEGRVSINGNQAKLGDRADLNAHILVDDKPIELNVTELTRVLIYHKPVGEITTRHDPEKRPTVFENLPELENGRWINIGRLDINTSGLLLFTNDGELANQLMHPSYHVEREYAVRVYGQVSNEILSRLQKGVKLEDGIARFTIIRNMEGEGVNQWFRVVVTEGRNRIVRRLWQSQGISISRLIRVRMGSILLPRTLKAGQWQELSNQDVAKLKASFKQNKIKKNK